MIGLAVVIMINEICLTYSEDQKCSSPYIEMLKFACSISTAILVFFMIWQISVIINRNSTKTYLSNKNIRWRQKSAASSKGVAGTTTTKIYLTLNLFSWKNFSRIVNLIINCIHPVPYLSLSVRTEMLGMTVVYRIEALIAVCSPFPTHVHAARRIHTRMTFT
jgi:hypothetical protein